MEGSKSSEEANNDSGKALSGERLEALTVSDQRSSHDLLSQGNITKTLDAIFFNPKAQKVLFWGCVINSVLLLLFPISRFFNPDSFMNIGFLPLLAAGFLSFLASPFYIYSESMFGLIKADKLKLDLRKWPCAKGAALLGIAVFAQWVLTAIFAMVHSEGLIKVINESFFISLLLPLLGVFSYWIGEKLLPVSTLREKQKKQKALSTRLSVPSMDDTNRPYSLGKDSEAIETTTTDPRRETPSKSRIPAAQSIGLSLKKYGRQNLTQVFPYLSFYSGFILFIGLVGLLPEGIGSCISSWLLASMRDANMLNEWGDTIIVDLVCGSAFSLLFISVLSPLFVRLSASFQSLLDAIFSNKSQEDFFSIFARILDTRSTRVALPPRHPHLRSAIQTLIYFTFCYLLLFGLVAFIPSQADFGESSFLAPLAALSSTISGWIYPSVEEANLFPHLTPSLRFFIASYIAAIAVTPFAVSACVFLPPRKEDSIFFSTQGVLMPNEFGRKLQFWSELKRVSIERLGKKKQTIKLVFRTKTVRLETSRMEQEKLAELLALADEYAADCFMDETAIKLRSMLSKETSTSSLSEHKKFESTIFVPHIPGDLVGDKRYRVIRKLLSKPLSAVYLVRSDDGQFAILKQFVTPNSNAKTLKQKASFMREYDLLKKLDHSNLAKVIETFEEAGACYIALEHIRGSDLRELIKTKGRRKEGIVLEWAMQICQQLKHMHEQDPPILHRDLSPDNLMLDEEGQMRIIDFGAAHQFMEGVTGTLIGKQSYIAPEQLRGKASVRSDIYSFGASLYYMLCAEDPKALQQSDLSNRDLEISNEMIAVVKHCTEFDESKRPQSIDALIKLVQEVPSSKKANSSSKLNKDEARRQILGLVEDLKSGKLKRDADIDEVSEFFESAQSGSPGSAASIKQSESTESTKQDSPQSVSLEHKTKEVME